MRLKATKQNVSTLTANAKLSLNVHTGSIAEEDVESLSVMITCTRVPERRITLSDAKNVNANSNNNDGCAA